ncbi:hypothetical protein GGX14DRAFT_574713 [Mycena pura]|uniref:Zn(2)-C6 fungal-type domain-containing protein n=1 Tax=Mycena pura TaxID=153505 RepID=A0AAD6UWD5_9AGAR|nr:hypothetical protein GGX14DRAFT_574713 [Mycena pura]
MPKTSAISSTALPATRKNLARGRACMFCRRRKIKCDGRKPVCSQCLRCPLTVDECVYPLEGRSYSQKLEETVRKLQSRVVELEAGAHRSLVLHDPYDNGDIPFAVPPFVEHWTSPSSVSTAATTSLVDTPTVASGSSSLVLEEPPPEIAEALVDAFLTNFAQVGFFLDPAAFRHSALLSYPFGHWGRPSPALLSAVYMWGARLASAPRHSVYNEDAFFLCAVHNIHQDLGGQHPHRLMHTLQAEILLSFYALTLGRAVEGAYHSSAAVSLVLSAGLNKLGSSRRPREPALAPYLDLDPPLPPPRDAREAGERVHAFWTTVVLSNYWAAARGSAAASSAILYPNAPIDTPWPRALEEYRDLAASPGSCFSPYATPDATPVSEYAYQDVFDAMPFESGGMAFLSGRDTEGLSPLALLAKASILLEGAIALSTRHCDAQAFESLDALLDEFTRSLPRGTGTEHGGRGVGGDMPLRSLVVTRCLAHTAVIRLHAHRIHTSRASPGKCLAAARAVAEAYPVPASPQRRHIDPIMGILWTTACEVFIAELASLQSLAVAGPGYCYLAQEYRDIAACLETILCTMRAFSRISPLIEHLSARLQHEYAAVTAGRPP